jgi:hypothetical protein
MTEIVLPKSRRKRGDGDTHRRCGDCTLCCTVMGVDDYPGGKDPGVQCPDVCSRGCRVYATRPQTCRDFACLWVQGGLPKWMRPNKIGIVFVSEYLQGQDVMLGHIGLAIGDRWLQNTALVEYLTKLGVRALPVLVGETGSGKVSHRFDQNGMSVRPPELDEDEG